MTRIVLLQTAAVVSAVLAGHYLVLGELLQLAIGLIIIGASLMGVTAAIAARFPSRELRFMLPSRKQALLGPVQPQEVDELATMVRGGKGIEAIGIYRQLMGVGLREAKEFVDSLKKSNALA